MENGAVLKPGTPQPGTHPDARPEPDSFASWRREILSRTELALEYWLPADGTAPARLQEAMRYAALGGGKRFRPMLCHAAGASVAADRDALDVVGAALEMIHVYSLVHDDLPAMDNDDLRRGKPTVHVRYDEATAILVGDALQSQAFVTLGSAPLPLDRRALLAHELARAAGPLGMAGGQMIDLASVGARLSRTDLEQMHRMKTGALIEAAVRMGALCAPGAEVDRDYVYGALARYAGAVGLAFQVMDDILDVTGDTGTLGKTAGKDARSGKPTFVSTIGLDASRLLARRLRDEARASLAPYGPRTRYLDLIADLVIERLH